MSHTAEGLDELRTSLSGWLTGALSIRYEGDLEGDMLNLRDWIDAGCPGEMPWPGDGGDDG